jgi:ATP-dependent DNA helicase RecQ
MNYQTAVRDALKDKGRGKFRATQNEKFAKPCFETAMQRFLNGWPSDGQFTADNAALLRQVIQWYGKEGGKIDCPWDIKENQQFFQYCEKAGISLNSSGLLEASSFSPDWFNETNASDPSEHPNERRFDIPIPGEQYLQTLGFTYWQCGAQKEAVWRAITAERGSSSVISLPTGTGKSLCFQLAVRLSKGLTIVIVPTVALAIDHFNSAKEIFENQSKKVNPIFYESDDPMGVVDHIRNGTTQLVFSSPEACVSGRLKSAIEKCLEEDRLDYLVIDEAHIIETWGVDFRVDFQLLGGLQKKWLEKFNDCFRTIFLSATYTTKSLSTLKAMFGGKNWQEFISLRMRPEMDYYVNKFDDKELQKNAVMDCAWQLPRPMIIYATKKDDAKKLYDELKIEGFQRVACFHGDTKRNDRRNILDKWRNNEIDIIVGTSAFGLVVDKADVRTIVHACWPENIDRYYQEVGRSGRDGYSANCFLLPTNQDRKTATGIAPKVLSDDDTINQRWDALWQSAEKVDQTSNATRLPKYLLLTAKKRVDLLGTRTWTENVKWNKRLLLMMHRTGLIEITDLVYSRPSSEEVEDLGEEKIEICLKNLNPNEPISKLLEAERKKTKDHIVLGLNAVDDLISGKDYPPCEIIRNFYSGTSGRPLRSCGTCWKCRENSNDRAGFSHLDTGTDETPSSCMKFVAVFGSPSFAIHQENIISMRDCLRTAYLDKGIRRFFVYEKKSEKLLLELMPEATGNAIGKTGPYRIDLIEEFSQNSAVNLEKEKVGYFHGDKPQLKNLMLRWGGETTHFISGNFGDLTTDSGHPIYEHENPQPKIYYNLQAWKRGV